jgi:hypothetical protein
VRSLRAGTAYIVARDEEQGKSDICVVTVLPLPVVTETLTLNTTLLSLAEGETSTLQAVASSGLAGKTITWSTSDGSVADVTSAGTVIAVGAGVCTVKATVEDYEANCIIVVTANNGGGNDGITVDNVTLNAARILIPAMTEASSYLVHLYRKTGGTLAAEYTLKVTPDGNVSMLRSSAGNPITVQLSYLESGTSYVADIETVRSSEGKTEIIRAETVAFTTKGSPPTGIEGVAAAAQSNVWYANNAVHLKNLSGYTVRLFNPNGSCIGNLRVYSDYETCNRRLPAGVHILTAEKDGNRKVFKLSVR